MNQQNLMQQYFEQQQQQSNMNGFPGAGFQSNQQIPNSYNGPTPVSNPYSTNSSYRQNGLGGRYSDASTFEMHSASPDNQAQAFPPGYIDPRMSNFDSRARPTFDPNGVNANMEAFASSSAGFPPSGKIRMNEMAAMFNNPAMAAAMQRRRLGMYGPGENVFISPTNPFSDFNPQALQLMQQQQRYEAFQRQLQQQLAAQQHQQQQQQHPPGSRAPPTDMNQHRYPEQVTTTPSSTPTLIKEINKETNVAQTTNNVGKEAFSNDKQTVEATHNTETGSPSQSEPQKVNLTKTSLQPKLSDVQNKMMKGMPFEAGSDAQKNAAMLAAAAVRAAAAATSRGRSSYPIQGMNNMPPYGPRGFPINNEQLSSPFPSQGMQSPDFGNVMSPNKDMSMIMQSQLSQGRGTPRSMPPPPYSPLPHSNDSNHSGSDSVKGSHTNLNKLANPPRIDETPHQQPCSTEGNTDQTSENKPSNQGFQSPKDAPPQQNSIPAADTNHIPNDRINSSSANKLSAPPTPISTKSAMSPASSLQDDLDTIEGLSPSVPQSPMSPDAQKVLKARASPRQYEQLSKVYDQINDEEKRNFMERYLAFMSVNGTPVTKLPIIGKQPLDLYDLFRGVCERGGIQEVLQKRSFREILTSLNLPTGNGVVAYMVKNQYMKYLHAYELKNKDNFLKQRKSKHVVTSEANKINVPTIALNETLKTENQLSRSTPHSIAPAWNSSYGNTAMSSNNSSAGNSTTESQYNPRMSYPNAMLPNQGCPTYGQSGISYGHNQEVASGYPGYSYQNQIYPRGPIAPHYGGIRSGLPNDALGGGWPRGYSPRQGPPELFPEGLQRMPWSQAQRHSMSAFSTPVYPNSSGKTRGSMPRDQLNQMNSQQLEQLKQEQQLKLQQYQQQQARFHHPEHVSKSSLSSKATRATHQHHQNEIKPPHTPMQPTKRELTFPPDSIEATKPITKKRKKMSSKDLGPVEAWRIMMSLKSGLVAECTWAIDTLNILLSDNNTITYFHLNKLPGLLDTLMDHYRRSLVILFEQFNELEIPLLPSFEKDLNEDISTHKTIDEKLDRLWVGVCKNSKTSFSSNIATFAVLGNTLESFDGGKKDWENGGGDNTSHIQTCFPTSPVQLNKYPDGLLYVTNADFEKQKKLDAMKKKKFENTSPQKCKNDLDDTESYSPKSYEGGSICLGVLDDLLKETNEDKSEPDELDRLIDTVIGNFELNIPADKKYLEDSKEFICYLNRRLQREHRGSIESEQCVVKQNPPFVSTNDCDESLYSRCVALSNIFRSLSFIQGNDAELSNHIGLILMTGYTLLHKHEHTLTDHSQFKLGLEERTVINNAFADSIHESHREALYKIRENMLVMLSNIGGHIKLTNMKEEIYKPLVIGLLHWVTCRSSEALDPMPTAPGSNALSAQRLSVEALSKMTINTNNVEFIVKLQNLSQIEDIGDILVKQVARKNPIPAREFAIILLDNLCCSKDFSQVLCKTKCAISNLVKFVYEAEKNTSTYLTNGGRVQPGLNAEDICGTSISLLRRSVNILLSLSKTSFGKKYISPHKDDILSLSTSQMIDTSVLAILASVLFELGA